MRLHETQNDVALDSHRFRVCCNGRRWGKTTLAIEEIKGIVLAADTGDKVAYIAPTYGQARDIAWEPLKKELEPIIISVNESRLELKVRTKNKGEALIVLRGWEAIETLRGQAFIFLVLDEVAMMRNFFTKWEEVLRPALADKQGDAMFISSPRGYNHFYDLFNIQDDNPDQWKSFHFSTYDNPFIPVSEIDAMKQTMTDDRFSQEVLAKFTKMEGLVYQEFDREIHMFGDDKLPLLKAKITDWYAGVDFGYTNPTAILKVGRDHDGNYYLIEEWVKTQKTNAEVIEYANTMGITAFYPDPAEPDRIEEMRRNKLNCREVNKDIGTGIDAVRNLLKNKKLFVHKSCINTIAEFESYAYQDKPSNKNDPEKPIDDNNHCFAPDTMIFTTKGKIAIKDLVGKKGWVYSRNGSIQKFHSVRETRKNSEMLNITFDDGQTISVTPDHLLLREDNVWVEAQLLYPMDLIQSVTYGANIQRESIQTLSWRKIFQSWEKKITQRNLEILQWGNTKELSYTSQRPQHSQQFDREFGTETQVRTSQRSYDCGETRSTKTLDGSHKSSFEEMAFIKRGKGVAQITWENNVSEKKTYLQRLRILSQKIFNFKIFGKCSILPSELQNESPTKKIIRITRGFCPITYNLEVENTHCVIADGVVAHNCMDALRYVLFMLSASSQQRTVNVHYSQSKPFNPTPPPTKLGDTTVSKVSVHYPSRKK